MFESYKYFNLIIKMSFQSHKKLKESFEKDKEDIKKKRQPNKK